MEYLFEFSQREDVQRLVDVALEDSVVQGVIVDIDPLWLDMWYLSAVVSSAELERYAYSIVYGEPWPWGGLVRDRLLDLMSADYVSYRRLDPHWVPPGWFEVAARLGFLPTPFVIRVVRLPKRGDEPNFSDFPELRVIVETRPPAFLYGDHLETVRPIVGGISIGAEASSLAGTLGGLLRSAAGERYAVTCSHVIQAGASAKQPADADVGRGLIGRVARLAGLTGDNGGVIGTCVASTALQPSVGRCNRYSASLNTVDAALIAIDPAIAAQLEILDIGPVAGFGWKGDIDVGRVVELVGKESGRQRVRVGGLGLVYEFRTATGAFCFDHVIELRHPSRFYGLYGTFNPPVRQGDSGAWVLSPGVNGLEWCASVVGGDGPTGYAVLTDYIRDWLRDDGRDDLVVV